MNIAGMKKDGAFEVKNQAVSSVGSKGSERSNERERESVGVVE